MLCNISTVRTLYLSQELSLEASISGLNLELGHVSPATFPLPTLGPVLKDLAAEIFSGRGFFVLRTIPVDSYSRYDNVLIYAGVSSYIGDRGLQDRNGGVLSHIIDLTKTKFAKEIGGPAYTTTPQVFHTDLGAEIVSLFALGVAAEGGTSRISSIGRVYNELAETRPDLIRTLAEPWAFEEYVLFIYNKHKLAATSILASIVNRHT